MATETIRVLCADDSDISLEGMRRILDLEPGIEVVGQISRPDTIVQAALEQQAQVVLLDLKWGGVFQAGYDIIQRMKQVCPEIRIIAITVYDHLIAGAKRAGADDVVTKDISGQDLVARIRVVAGATGQLLNAKQQLDRLRHVPAGDWRAASEHESCVLELLRFCLEPELTGWETQKTALGRVERPDIICSNFSQNPFWAAVRELHGAQQIVFQLKNTRRLRKEHLEQLALSLGGLRGRLGFVVARASPGAAFRRAAYLPYTNDGKVVLALSDGDLSRMVELKAAGKDPTTVVIERYQEFIRPYAGL